MTVGAPPATAVLAVVERGASGEAGTDATLVAVLAGSVVAGASDVMGGVICDVTVVTVMPVTFPFTFAFAFLPNVPRASRVARLFAAATSLCSGVSAVAFFRAEIARSVRAPVSLLSIDTS